MPLDPAVLERYLDKLRRKAQSLEFSRRRFLQATLAVGTVQLPLASLSDRTRVLLRDGRAVFFLDNMPRWTIGPDRFAGDATLDVLKHTDNEIALHFSGVHYPGTSLDVEVTCHIRRSLGGWYCDFEFHDLGHANQVDLVSWLSGEPIRLSCREKCGLFPPGHPINVKTASGPISIDASWTLRFRQASVDLIGVRSPLYAENVSLRPAPSGYKSLLIDTNGPGSLITLERGRERWGSDFMELLLRNCCTLSGPSELFSSLEIECFESKESPSITAVFIPENEGTHKLAPPGSLRDRADRPFSLSLAQPMYAIAVKSPNFATATFSTALTAQHTAFTSNYALLFDNPVHITGSISAITSSDPLDEQDKRDFGFTQLFLEQYQGDEEAKFDFLAPSNQNLGLWDFGAHPFGRAPALRSLWHWLFHRNDILPIDGIVLRVARARDFLFLSFTFANMAISVRGGKPWLVANPASAKPVLTVYFLPQHFQEETFEENSQGGADGAQPALPVDMTLSGPTSLSFNFPLRQEGEPLTLANLLAWQAGAMRAHNDGSNLSADQQASKLHNTSIEAPYRLLIDTIEDRSSWLHQHSPQEDGKETPELWHTSLVSQSVQIASAVRAGNNVTITFKTASTGWKANDTFAVLEPLDFAGTFVLTAAAGNTVGYSQALPDLTRTNFTMSLANRFVAYSAVDYAPPIKKGGISWNNGISTIQFTGSVPFHQGDLINITPPDQTNVCNTAPGPSTTFEVASVHAQDTITVVNLLNIAIADGSLVSLLTATNISKIHVISVTVHVTTEAPHGLRPTDAAFFGATGTVLDGKTLAVADVVSGTEFTVKLLSPGFTTLGGKGKVVINRVFTVKSGGQERTVMQPILYPITTDDRRQVVELSPLQPLAMEQLILSALGGWASMEGNFTPDPKKGQGIERFIYRFSQRRDYYVEVDDKGYLWPFGHRAILIKVTQRFFYSSQDSVTPDAKVCYLRTRFFVVVKQKTRSFITPSGTGLQLPFVRIDILTDSTPPLYALNPTPPGVDPSDSACNAWFWPSLAANQPYLFQLRGYDSGNPPNAADFSAPLVFVSAELGAGDLATSSTLAALQALSHAYTTRTLPDGSVPRNRVPFAGVPLHFAESKTPGDTELHVTSIDFSAALLDAKPANGPIADPSKYIVPGDIDPGLAAADPRATPVKFHPVLLQAAVDVPSVNVFSGQTAGRSGSPVHISYNAQFLKSAFNLVTDPKNTAKKVNPNPTEIFVDVQVAAGTANLQYPGPKGGGMAVPVAPITSFARHTGIVADGAGSTWDPTAAGATPPSFDPLKSFDLSNAKLLGCIPIGEAIEVISDLGANLKLAPSLNLQKVYSAVEAVESAVTSVGNAINGVEDNLDHFNQEVRAVIDKTTAKLNNGLKSWTTEAIGTAGNENDPINCLAQLYNRHAASLKATLAMMENAANGPVPQYEFDDLRAAGDIALSSNMTQRVVSRLDENVTKLSNKGVMAVCTLQDLDKKLRGLVVSALRQLSPDNLPTMQVAAALDELVKCFDPKLGVPSVTKIRNKAFALQKAVLTLWKALARTTKSIDPRLFDTYLTSTVKALKSDAEYALAQLKDPQPPLSTSDWGKGLLQRALHDHKVAFLDLYAQFNSTYCGGHLPKKPTYQAAAELAEAYVSQAQVMGEAVLDRAIDDALSGLADDVAAVLTQPILGELQTALNQFDAALALCNEVVDVLQTPVSVTATYALAKIPMKDAPSGDPIFLAHRMSEEGTKKALLEIDARVSAGLTPLQPQDATGSASTQVTLSDFSLQLLPGAPFITVQFDSFRFTAGTGQGTQSHCKLDPVNPVILGDALEFVSELVSAFAPMGGGGLSPVISLFGSGLGVGYNFKLPQIQAGGFQISGLAFEALLLLSFTGGPLKLRFYLATPQKHFLMSAGIFGGGGFFGLELSSAGVDLVQGCMEFGAAAGLNLGVANGEVHILGGFYFEFGDRRCLLTGFVRAGGSLNILDIVEMSVEFYIGLTYRKIGNQTSVYGTCTVTVSISILFFSADVSMTMEWQWAGSRANNNTASLETETSPPLYAMLETGASLPSYMTNTTGNVLGGIADHSGVYSESAGSEPCPIPPRCNPRLVGWTEEMWNVYTAAFMED